MAAVTAKLAVLAAVSACLAASWAGSAAAWASVAIPNIASAQAQADDVNARAGDGSTKLQWAVYNSDVAEVTRLIKAGADVKIANSYGATAMSLAANTGNAEIIKLLLNAGADVESANAEAQTALMEVARTGNVEAAKLLLKAGANVNARENWGQQTALMWAAAQRQPQMIKVLLQHGADVNARGIVRNWDRKVTAEGRPKDMNRGGFTPLLYAAREGCVACVDELLKGKADINLEDPHGTTPLVLALMNMKFDTAKFLIEKGADISLWDYYGQTPLYVAVDMHQVPAGFRADVPSTDKTESMDLIQMLLDRGANVNAQLKLRPPVRSLLPGDRGADVRVLKAAGADPNARTTGSTPLLTATTRSWKKVMTELVSYGVDVNATDSDGLTALDYAMARIRIGFLQQKPPVHMDLAKMLKDWGATVENPNLPPWPSVATPTITAQVPND